MISPPAAATAATWGLSPHPRHSGMAVHGAYVFLVLLSSLQASWAIGEYGTRT